MDTYDAESGIITSEREGVRLINGKDRGTPQCAFVVNIINIILQALGITVLVYADAVVIRYRANL